MTPTLDTLSHEQNIGHMISCHVRLPHVWPMCTMTPLLTSCMGWIWVDMGAISWETRRKLALRIPNIDISESDNLEF